MLSSPHDKKEYGYFRFKFSRQIDGYIFFSKGLNHDLNRRMTYLQGM